MPISQNQALFSLLGIAFGGDGRVNFGLPDLRGRTPVSIGQGIALGERGGEETHVLTAAEVPGHTHPINATTNLANSPTGANNLLGLTATGVTVYKTGISAGDSPLHANTIGSAGGNVPHENRAPYLAMSWCISLSGIYPTRT
jgi:microcystin-dependent protein